MTTQRISTLTALMILGLAVPAWLSASHPPRAADAATVRVANNNAQPVYVVLIDKRPDGWAQWPLGTIEATATRTFQVPRSAQGSPNIQIVASAFSNWKKYQSRPLTLRSGRRVDLTLNDPEPYSRLAVR